MILTFGELEYIIKNKNIEFVRSFKDDLIPLSWEYFSTSPIFTIDELREFKDYIDWNGLFTTNEIIRYYGVNNLKEFEVLLESDIRKMYEDEKKIFID